MILVALGLILLLEPALEALALRVRVPKVSLLLAFGLLLTFVPTLLTPEVRELFPVLAEVALAIVGFLLGGEFVPAKLRAYGRAVLALSVAVTVATAAIVAAACRVAGLPWTVALLLGAAATATDPAACMAVSRDGDTRGPATSVLLGIVAIDDVWGLLLFSAVLGGLGVEGGSGAATAVWEVVGSVGLGVALGLPMAAITGRLRPGQPTRMEALGFLLTLCGLAELFDLPYLLAAVIMGAVVANVARHHETTFREIDDIERPFLALFFVLSGATVALDRVLPLLPMLAVYVVARGVGRLVGSASATVGARLDPAYATMGLALLPQAGVAVGMMLVAAERFPEVGHDALSVVVVATVLFETVGPVLTGAWLRHADRARG